jgi:hypothetical protein
MDTITVIERIGIPGAALFAVIVMLDKKVWPFIVAQITAWQTDRKAERESMAADRVKERDAFLASIAGFQQTANAAHQARINQDIAFAQQVEALAKAVQQVAVLVQHNYNALHVVAPHIQKRKVHPMQ